ncbi:hypothetical protein J1605_022768 [Eschrichtius robustus]|uniref:Uncharacterized protein n=1 Tax=Eschrichtius robustus TaxID=9764 RepID=A0AB34H8H3_ESCRO|nr:hypothetical protein J1605_022768 [Eschrichtius robustus]
MKDLGAEYLAGREGVQLFGLLNLYLEQEQRFQPREKGLSLIEATPENDNTFEDSCEDMSCGEESLSSSPHGDQECTFFFSFKVAQTLCFPS